MKFFLFILTFLWHKVTEGGKPEREPPVQGFRMGGVEIRRGVPRSTDRRKQFSRWEEGANKVNNIMRVEKKSMADVLKSRIENWE